MVTRVPNRVLLAFLLAVSCGSMARAATPTGEDYHKAGLKLKAAGNCPKAVLYFAYALKLDPSHAEACRQMGNCYSKMGDKAKADEAFGASLTIRPGDLTLAGMRGVARKAEKKGEKPTGPELLPPMHFGVKLGAGVFNQTVFGATKDGSMKDVIMGGGGYYSLRLTQRLSFQPELFYCQTKLYDASAPGVPAAFEGVHTIGYLSISPLLKGHAFDNGYGGFFMGPSLRIKTNDSFRKLLESNASPRAVKAAGFGVLMGFELGFGKRVGFELRGDYGLGDWVAGPEGRRSIDMMGNLIVRFVN